jgi:hypothetical protein
LYRPAAPLDSMNEAGAVLLACRSPPANSADSSVTLSLSFKRDGTLIGQNNRHPCRRRRKARNAYVDAATRVLRGLTAGQLLAVARARGHCLHAEVQLAEE